MFVPGTKNIKTIYQILWQGSFSSWDSQVPSKQLATKQAWWRGVFKRDATAQLRITHWRSRARYWSRTTQNIISSNGLQNNDSLLLTPTAALLRTDILSDVWSWKLQDKFVLFDKKFSMSRASNQPTLRKGRQPRPKFFLVRHTTAEFTSYFMVDVLGLLWRLYP